MSYLKMNPYEPQGAGYHSRLSPMGCHLFLDVVLLHSKPFPGLCVIALPDVTARHAYDLEHARDREEANDSRACILL